MGRKYKWNVAIYERSTNPVLNKYSSHLDDIVSLVCTPDERWTTSRRDSLNWGDEHDDLRAEP